VWKRLSPARAPRGPTLNLNLAKCLELALNDGRDRLTGIVIGPATGPGARQFAGFEVLFQAYECQVEAALVQMLAAKDECMILAWPGTPPSR